MPRTRPDAFTQALKLLAARDRTEAQVRDGLHARGYAEAEVVDAIERARALGYLDDGRVARAVAQRTLAEGRSLADVSQRLVRRGVDEATAAQTVAGIAAEMGVDDLATARALLVRRKLSGVRAARFLAQRGFDEDLIRRLVSLDEP